MNPPALTKLRFTVDPEAAEIIVASPALLETLVAVKFETFSASATAPLLTIITSPVLRSLISTEPAITENLSFPPLPVAVESGWVIVKLSSPVVPVITLD